MENKIQVEEYIRTYDGIIGKILEDEDIGENGVYIDTTFLDDYADETNFVKYEDIKKHSFNIINLIEERDVIVLKDNKKYEVLKISWSKSKGKHIHIIYPLRMYGGIDIFENDIKSIVTKEQFERMKYEV